MDNIDDSSDEDGNKKDPKAKQKGITAQLEMEAKEIQKIQDKKKAEGQNDLESDRDTDGEEKKTEILDRARKSIHKKKKEKKKKKRRRIQQAESDSSGSDFNPFA